MLRALPLLLLATSACHAMPTAPISEHELSVMTFNIRYGTARDGEHVWPARRDRVAERIVSQAPDVLAIQEGLDFQLDELSDALKGYRKLGQHREGGKGGEFSGLYVREDRVQVLGWGEFWLSSTPDTVASRGWDAALPRMAVWADVQLRSGGTAVRVYGTHFDHRGSEARLRSSELMLRDAAGAPRAIAMGDFNAEEDSAPVGAFYAAGWKSAVAVMLPGDPRGTFNGFRDPTGGRRIDHIFFWGLEPTQADILGGPVGELFPSDHDAVIARFPLD